MAVNIDVDAITAQYEDRQKINNIIHNKQLNKDINKMIEPRKRQTLKILKGQKIKPPKIITADNPKGKAQENEIYKYTRYINSFKQEILPRVVNNIAFNNKEFVQRIKKCKDYQQSVNSVLDFEITDPIYGFIATMGGLVAEQLYGVPIPENEENNKPSKKKKETDTEAEAE